MGSDAVIDVEALLGPIPGDLPTGPDLRADGSSTAIYFRVKDARNAARAAERAAEDPKAGLPPQWSSVAELGLDVISGHAKDLEVAAWLAEALVRVDGFAGLRDGFDLIAGLAARYWDTIHPMPDEDGLETRLAAIGGLAGSGAVGTLALGIRMAPLTQGSETSFSLWHYEQANEVEKVPDPARKKARIDAGATSLEAFNRSVAETPATVLRDRLLAVEACLASLKALGETLDRLAGADSPSMTGAKDLLERVAGAIRFFAADKLRQLPADEPAAPAPAGEESVAAAAEPGIPAPRRTEGFANRDEALDALGKLALHFRRTEPQSPLSYTLDEAVRRARMTLPELLEELMQDANQRRLFLVSAGIKPPETA